MQICLRQNQVEMASGRRSGDPKDLLLVDPSQPEATKRARRHLTKRQKEIFVQYGFSKALLGEVISAGWDQVDINNYVLYYNSQVETTLAVRAPGLDMSMKQTINAIIRTKLQGQEEREIGLVTPANPIHEMTEDFEETDLDNMSQEELDELQNQLDQELQVEFQEEVPNEVQ